MRTSSDQMHRLTQVEVGEPVQAPFVAVHTGDEVAAQPSPTPSLPMQTLPMQWSVPVRQLGCAAEQAPPVGIFAAHTPAVGTVRSQKSSLRQSVSEVQASVTLASV